MDGLEAILVVLSLLGSPAATTRGADFNGDGYADLAVCAAADPVDGVSGVGTVSILYGSSGGLTATGSERLDLSGIGKGFLPTSADNFGLELAHGDFDGDGFDDLAIADASRTIGGVAGAGCVFVVPGSQDGLRENKAVIWHQNRPGVLDQAEAKEFPFFGELFASALAAGDFDGDGRDDLAIGVLEKVGGIEGAGAVHVLYGSKKGLSGNGDQLWHQNRSGVADSCEEGDNFGARLAAGDFNGDGRSDLAISVPNEELGAGATLTQGAVAVLFGRPNGLSAKGDLLLSHVAMGGALADTNALLECMLVAGDFDGDGKDDLAVGALHSEVSGVAGAGRVFFLRGGALEPFTMASLHENSAGVPGTAETGDFFGVALAAGDFDGDGAVDLAVGAQGQEVSGEGNAGAVYVLAGTVAGPLGNDAQLWTQDEPSVADSAEEHDLFGRALGAGDFDGDGAADLAIGVSSEATGGVSFSGAFHVLYGTVNVGLTAFASDFFTQDTAVAGTSKQSSAAFGYSFNR